MAKIPIYPGSSSFFPGDTPFGFYDYQLDFQTDADRVVTYCARRLGYPIMDVEDPISGQYNLEVSSPGIERPLFTIDHYRRFLGNEVSLRLYRPIDGRRKFTGNIGSISEANNTIELVTELGPLTMDLGLIEKANLIAHF